MCVAINPQKNDGVTTMTLGSRTVPATGAMPRMRS